MTLDPFSQSPYRCRFDWGTIGAGRAAERGDIVVIVDVLSFSTSVAYAVSQGAIIYPCSENENSVHLANKLDAVPAVPRQKVPQEGRYSLSPLTYSGIEEGTRIVIPSLNGGTCVQCARSAAYVLAGSLLNPTAVARKVEALMRNSNLNVTVIACGEREKNPPFDLRPAIEDFLGAGAILSHLPFDKSPEAQVGESAYTTNSQLVSNLIWDSVSGRELRGAGFGEDVEFASRIDLTNTTPVLKDLAFCTF